MSELDDLEIYVVPGIETGTKRPLRYLRPGRNRRLSDAEADRIFARVKAEIAATKAKGDRK